MKISSLLGCGTLVASPFYFIDRRYAYIYGVICIYKYLFRPAHTHTHPPTYTYYGYNLFLFFAVATPESPYTFYSALHSQIPDLLF